MMKKLALILVFMIGLCIYVNAEPRVSARSAALVEMESGRLLYGKNENEQRPMASTTKIMTTLVAIESGRLDEGITVTDEMVRVEGSSMGLLPGYKVTLLDLCYGMLLQSGNDASNAVAFHLSGSLEGFSVLMNEKAKELGLENSNFITPSGLDAPGHCSTALDMARLGAAAMKNSTFAEIAGSRSAAIEVGNPPARRKVYNHNRLLTMYKGANGVKTGFTKKSGRCLVSSAERDGVRLVAVTLNAGDDWNDHRRMLDYGFSILKGVELDDSLGDIKLSIAGGERAFCGVSAFEKPVAALKDGEISRVERKIEMPRFEYAPIKAGQVVGKMRYFLDGNQIAQVDIVADEDIEYLEVSKEKGKGFFERIWSFFAK